MPGPPPTVSVVVATHRRRRLLARLVAALEAQQLQPAEVVIVDDGSDDGTMEELEALQATARVSVVPLRLDRASGPATARNLGWRRATGDIVAFTDDDCVPQPGWLKALAAALGPDSGYDLAQGLTEPDPDRAPGRGPFARTMWVLEPDGFYATCNIAYRRRVLEELGGFDERFRRPFGEDTDLAWRAIESGSRDTFVAEAVVHHEVWPSSWPQHLRDRGRREGIVLAARLHPGIRHHFYRPYWYQGSHPRALLGALGAAVVASGPRRPAAWLTAGALAAPYVHHRLVDRPLPCRRRNLAPVIALAWLADLAEVGVLVAASARYRALLL
ncbi:MAG TPA: glycosyltransferase [Acidimicrobiales bacterium]|nr:glycosyltransferase [Acidimicrobiales bacterium]